MSGKLKYICVKLINMKYQLIENYFQTELFQTSVQDYFNTVLAQMLVEDTTRTAKGLYFVDGKRMSEDKFDMSYHIHILNGLIPALYIYEQYMMTNDLLERKESDALLRIFILGFTFHDANKMFHTKYENGRSDLENAILKLDDEIAKSSTLEFFPELQKHKSTIYHLILATENGTFASAGNYAITVTYRDEVTDIQTELCHLADGLASLQGDNLTSIEYLFKSVQKSLNSIRQFSNLSISYLKVRVNPYTLLSQNLLQVARKTLGRRGKKILYSTQEGFIFWGEDMTDEEFDLVESAYLKGSEEDLNILELTNIDAQKCKFGFIGSTPFNKEVLERVTADLGNKFLALSPNSRLKIADFDNFLTFNDKIIDAYDLPIEPVVKDDKLNLNWYEEAKLNEDDKIFRTIYNLHKIQWLNVKEQKTWKADLQKWVETTEKLPVSFSVKEESTELTTVANFRDFIAENVNATSAIFKTYLNFLKTYQVTLEEDDLEEYIENLQTEIIETFTPKVQGTNVKKELFDRYFECRGHANLRFLEGYAPHIPIKKEMCAFTGGRGTVDYKQEVAFAMKARGFSNRTVTALNNNTSHISALFAEENKLRASQFKISDANLVIYYDFFETKLDIDREIIRACVAAKDELKILDNQKIQFDKTAKFDYNLYNLEFIKLAPKVEPTFFLIRKCLRMVKLLGVRSYIAGIMTPYQAHEAIFHFENAPRFVKLLGWDAVRLAELEEVLDEMRLILTFGKNRIESNLLKIAKSRLAYFSIYYGLNDDDKRKVHNTFVDFFKKYKFPNMTITENLVELAVKVTIGFKSSAEETWIIRTALDYLRTYHKRGSSREDIIQKICGELYRKLRMNRPDTEAIKAFAEAIYDELFLKDWKGEIPSMNIEKDWIYQFAFLFREKSLEVIRTPKAKKIKSQLDTDGLVPDENNIKNLLDSNSKRNAKQYLQIIKNL